MQTAAPVESNVAAGSIDRGLRLMIFDDTCRGRDRRFPLTYTWLAGRALYRALGRLDHGRAVRSWAEALEWLCTIEPERSIAEVQYWGHGKWGEVRIAQEVMDEGILDPYHPLHTLLCAVRSRLCGPEALWWFRTCETLGAHKGQAFAQAWAQFMDCRVAGHTHIIGPWQSGLHQLRPGQTPHWSPSEGLAPGSTPERPVQALWSGPRKPNTITCLAGHVPDSY